MATPKVSLLGIGLILLAPPTTGEESLDPCEGRNPLHCQAQAVAPEQPSQTPEDPGCRVKNPFYCGVPVSSHDGEVVVTPPGGCEGKNPLYCRETPPEVEAKQEEPPRGERQNARSENPHRNPKQNPRVNPNRRSRPSGP